MRCYEKPDRILFNTTCRMVSEQTDGRRTDTCARSSSSPPRKYKNIRSYASTPLPLDSLDLVTESAAASSSHIDARNAFHERCSNGTAAPKNDARMLCINAYWWPFRAIPFSESSIIAILSQMSAAEQSLVETASPAMLRRSRVARAYDE